MHIVERSESLIVQSTVYIHIYTYKQTVLTFLPMANEGLLIFKHKCHITRSDRMACIAEAVLSPLEGQRGLPESLYIYIYHEATMSRCHGCYSNSSPQDIHYFIYCLLHLSFALDCFCNGFASYRSISVNYRRCAEMIPFRISTYGI